MSYTNFSISDADVLQPVAAFDPLHTDVSALVEQCMEEAVDAYVDQLIADIASADVALAMNDKEGD